MARSIELTYYDKVFTYKTLVGAQKRARRILGLNPLGIEGMAETRKPDLYSKKIRSLGFTGCTFEELFPPECEVCGKVGSVDYEEASDLHLCESCWTRWAPKPKEEDPFQDVPGDVGSP